MPRGQTLIAAAATMSLAIASAQERLPTVPPSNYTAEQEQAATEFEAARKVPVFGPFEPLMYSPQLMNRLRATGDYLRYRSAIGTTLSELAILVTRASGPRTMSGMCTVRSPSRPASRPALPMPSPMDADQAA
jgi:hypothetical protein